MYDKNNIFAKVLRGELPMNKKVYENNYAVSFHDINPAASVHVLVIPKGEYKDILDFNEHATMEEKAGLWDAVTNTIKIKGVEDGFRISSHVGKTGGQTVFHMHLHIMADQRLAMNHR